MHTYLRYSDVPIPLFRVYQFGYFRFRPSLVRGAAARRAPPRAVRRWDWLLGAGCRVGLTGWLAYSTGLSEQPPE